MVNTKMEIGTIDNGHYWIDDRQIERFGTLSGLRDVLGETKEVVPLIHEQATLYNVRTLLSADTFECPVATAKEACDLLLLAHYLDDELGKCVMGYWIKSFGSSGLETAFFYLPDGIIAHLATLVEPQEIYQLYEALNQNSEFDTTFSRCMSITKPMIDVSVHRYLCKVLVAREDTFGYRLNMRVVTKDLIQPAFREMLLRVKLDSIRFFKVKHLPKFTSRIVTLQQCRGLVSGDVYTATKIMYLTTGCEFNLDILFESFPNVERVGLFSLSFLIYCPCMRNIKHVLLHLTSRVMSLPDHIEYAYISGVCFASSVVNGRNLKRVYCRSGYSIESSTEVEYVQDVRSVFEE